MNHRTGTTPLVLMTGALIGIVLLVVMALPH